MSRLTKVFVIKEGIGEISWDDFKRKFPKHAENYKKVIMDATGEFEPYEYGLKFCKPDPEEIAKGILFRIWSSIGFGTYDEVIMKDGSTKNIRDL